ncbi:TRAP transporter large permease subunit [Rhodococcus opacus]|uniref:TRAP transporter large permease subunit n=1 Tax=Rhodococcus opacus TaxID=37919 RepID=UPI00155AF0DA|nr:TRAP transporter large permease subunit [Rhodococcus opacus]
MSGIWALIAFIGVIVVFNSVLKRNIGESMIAGFVACAAFGGTEAVSIAWHGLIDAMQEEVTFATLTFVFMSYLLSISGVMDRLIAILSSLLGRYRGGSAYSSTVASGLFGVVAHAGSAITATVGSVTIPWMQRSKVSGPLAATIVAGNAGMGITFPLSSSFFILTTSATVAPLLSADDLVVPLFAIGAWCLLYRLIVVTILIRKHNIQPMDAVDIQPLRRSFASGWQSLLIFVGIAIPVLATIGPTGQFISDRVGEDAEGAISLITWLPVFILTVGFAIGWKALPRKISDWWSLLGETSSRVGVVGVTMVAAFAASNVLASLGLPAQLTELLENVGGMPTIVVATLVGILVMLVAAPLTSTATIAAIGPVAFATLVSAGVPPAIAAGCVLVFSSTEGASPPGAPPIYVASGIAGIDPSKTFKPLIIYYVIPVLFIGVFMAIGYIPLPA